MCISKELFCPNLNTCFANTKFSGKQQHLLDNWDMKFQIFISSQQQQRKIIIIDYLKHYRSQKQTFTLLVPYRSLMLKPGDLPLECFNYNGHCICTFIARNMNGGQK